MNLKDYKNLVAEQGCIVMGCEAPAQLHHPRFCCGLSQRASDWLVIPLCPDHHQHGGPGVALHADQTMFERMYGTEEQLLANTIARAVSGL